MIAEAHNPPQIHPAHAPHSVPALKPIPETLDVVAPVINPQRYRSRYRLYRTFEKHVADAGARLTTVEVAFGNRPFEVTETGNPRHVQLRSSDELWFKENALNIGIQRLPAGWNKVAVVDADFTFARSDWAQETLQQLEHYAAVQMFNTVTYLDANENVVLTREGFASVWQRGGLLNSGRGKQVRKPVFKGVYSGPGAWGPPGGAWAFRRDALDGIGGLIDYTILGSGDFFMAYGLIGHVENAIPTGYAEPFTQMLINWQTRAMRAARGNVGIVPGTALHHFHGPMADRNYNTRESILQKWKFNPATDLKRDSQGLWQLEDDNTPRFIGLRDDIRAYFRARNEDALS
jgi:hypothetical protein